MKGLLQRARGARVEVDGEIVGSIDQGLLVLVAVEPGDTPAHADKLLHKLLNYRVFSDPQGKMNLSLKDIDGGLLLVSQFTLAADTQSGLRPSFPPPRHRHSVPNCSTICWPRRGSSTPRWRAGVSVRTCRFTWSMMAL